MKTFHPCWTFCNHNFHQQKADLEFNIFKISLNAQIVAFILSKQQNFISYHISVSKIQTILQHEENLFCHNFIKDWSCQHCCIKNNHLRSLQFLVATALLPLTAWCPNNVSVSFCFAEYFILFSVVNLSYSCSAMGSQISQFLYIWTWSHLFLISPF